MENLSRSNSIFENLYINYIIFDNRKSIDGKRDCKHKSSLFITVEGKECDRYYFVKLCFS